VSCSPHKIRFHAPLRNIWAGTSRELLLTQAEVDERLRDQFQNGFDAGQKSLGEQLMQQRSDLLQVQNGVLKSLRESLPAVIQNCEQALAQLAIETVARVIGDIPISTEIVESALRLALEELKGTTEYVVHLHPADLELLVKNESDLLPKTSASPISFSPDNSVTRGGCLVQTSFGVIDARRETKLARAREAVAC